MDSALPIVYALRGKERKEKKRKRNVTTSLNNTGKKHKNY
jgi:hypothetical protein